MSIDVNVQNDLVIVTETTEDIVVNVSNAAGPQGPAGAAGVGVPVGGTTGQVLKKFTNTNYDTYWAADASGLTSVGLSVPTGLTVTNSPLTTNGTLAVGLASGYSIPTTASQATWNTAYNDSIVSAAVTGTTTKTLTLNQQDGGSVTASWSDLNTDAVTSVFGRTGAVVATEGDYTLTQLGDVTLTSPTNGQVLKYNGTTWVNNTDTDTGLTSVGLSMPSAFSVSNSPLTSNGTLAVTGAGTSAQYVRGDGQLANFPTNGGGGSSVNYYLNGSVSQGTFGGDTYYEMSKSPIAGAGTNFTRTSAQGNGYIASFITDANDPSLLVIPGGNWNLEFYFNASSGGGTPSFYAELYKVSSSNVFTLVSSGSTNPEGITQGTVVDQYFTSIPVAQTALLATDRIAVRIFVTPDGRNITLHTENSNLCEVLTTFSTGLNALNGLTAQVQYFATGTSGTDFAISSATDIHTFNLPIASGTNTGKLSNTDWTTFNSKQNAITLTTTGTSGASTFISNTLNIPTYTLSGLGGVPTTRTLTINGTTYDLSADRSWTIPVHDAVTIGTANGLSLSTQALSLALSSASTTGALSSTDWTTFNGKQAALNGTGFVKISGTTISYDNSTYYLASNPSAYIALTALTASAPLSYNNTTGAFTIAQASGSVNGFLSSTDWTTFNNKQNTLTNPVTGTGTTNYLPKWTSGSVIGNSNLFNDANGNVGIAVVPSNAFIGSNTLEIGANGVIWSETASSSFNSLILGLNFYYNAGGTPVYKNSGVESSRYFQYQGSHQWYTAPSGTAGNAISFTQTMTLFATGNLGIGVGGTDSGEKLQVSGNVLATSFIKSGGTSSQYLMADGSVTTGGGLISTNRQTASYTLALTDADKLVEMNVATANNLTVPLNSSVAFAIGTKIDLAQYGAGQTTVVATGGVTVRSAGGALKLSLQYSGATLVKIATNEWYLFGDITV